MSSKYFPIPAGTQLQTSKTGSKGVYLNLQWITISKNLIPAFEDGATGLLAEEVVSTQTVTSIGADGKPVLEDRATPVTLLRASAVGKSMDELIRVSKSTELFEARANVFIKAETKKFMAEYQLTEKDLAATA